MKVVIFEDAGCEALAPITMGRIAASITCGSYRLVDLITLLGAEGFTLTRPYMRAIQEIDYPIVKDLVGLSMSLADQQPDLLLNARVIPSIESLSTLQKILACPIQPSSSLIWDRGNIAAIISPKFTLGQLSQIGHDGLETLLLSIRDFPTSEHKLTTFESPHEVISGNMSILSGSLEHRIATGAYRQQQDGVFLAEGAKLGSYVLCESQSGPIVIDRDATVGPYTLLRGPIYVGPKSKILEHAAIKDRVSLGHTTKIGGEVEASVVEPYTNKQHHGFLGHSYLGSWINLGAGTCNSDLKNTYGAVNMEYGPNRASTGMQFLGCIMGDYSKSAINTGIFTGKVIGVCSMMYGFVTSNVPSFVNYARLFGQMATLPAEVMIASQQRMFARRNVQQRDCDIQLIHDMYRLTQSERDRFGDGLG